MTQPSYIVFDLETTGLVPGVAKIHGLSVQFEGDREPRPYVRFEDMPASWKEALADEHVLKVGHNVRFDIKHLRANGITIHGPLYCTMNAGYVLNENQRIALDDLVEKYLGPRRLEGYKKLQGYIESKGLRHVGEICALDIGGGLDDEGRALLYDYGTEDVRNTYDLFPVLKAKLRELSDVLRRRKSAIEETPESYLRDEVLPTEELLCDVELAGIRVDMSQVTASQRRLADRKGQLTEALLGALPNEIKLIEEELYLREVAGLKKADAIARRAPGKGKAKFNFASGQHLAKLFYEACGVKPGTGQGPHRTDSGNLSTDDLALQAIAEGTTREDVKKFISLLQEYRNLSKNLTTYIGNSERGFLSLVRNETFYPSYDSRIVTGRLGSFAHTFPRDFDVTKALVPTSSSHVFVYFDYSAIELRIAAHLSRDEEMCRWFSDGIDPHKATASRLFGVEANAVTDEQRQVGKRTNFLLIYDGSAWRLEETLRTEVGLSFSVEECQAFRDAFFQAHPTYRRHMDALLRGVFDNGYVQAENGRIRRLPEIAYGRSLDWKAGLFKGTREQAILLGGGSDKELFVKAKRAYNHAKKQALNFPIQSMGATLTKRACIAAVRTGYKLVYTKHDCAIFEVPVSSLACAVSELRNIAENSWPMSIPLVAEFKLLNSLYEKDRNLELEEKYL